MKTKQQIGRASKRKGSRGELELSKILNSFGYETRRTRQYCGTNGTADIEGLPHIHAECKRVEKLNIHKAIEQAIRDCKNTKNIPTVFHRKNNTEWLFKQEPFNRGVCDKVNWKEDL